MALVAWHRGWQALLRLGPDDAIVIPRSNDAATPDGSNGTSLLGLLTFLVSIEADADGRRAL